MAGKGLLDRDMAALFAAFTNPIDERTFRDRALLLIMSKTAARASEVVGLRWSQLFQAPDGTEVFRFRRKGNRVAFAVPGREALRAVREYHSHAGIESDWLFHSLPWRNNGYQRTRLSRRGLQLIVNSWDKLTCNGRMVHPHAIRHTAIQKAFDEGGSIVAQKVAQHSTPVTTSRFYTKPYHDASDILRWDADCEQ